MNVTDFIHILQNSNTILSPKQTRELEDIIGEYPYFQAARALHLKGLKNLDSYKYNNALKAAAAHTVDRDVLFDYVTSEEFVQNNIAETIAGRGSRLEDHSTISEEVEPNPDTGALVEESEGTALPRNLQDAEQILSPALFRSKGPEAPAETPGQATPEGGELDLGRPIPFTKREKHSFTQWLQLTNAGEEKLPKATAAGKAAPREPGARPAEPDPERRKKFELLDRFIANNPKIVPQESPMAKVDLKMSSTLDKNELMTESLARVYLEQKEYKKGIQAFKIWSLKYPEKSGFFADQIQAVRKLQNEKEE